MKYVIDLIDDIRSAINNDGTFSLQAMGLQAQDNGNMRPSWQSNITRYSVDKEQEKVYFYLGKERAIDITTLVQELNTLANKEMMYTLHLSFSKEGARIDEEIIGFGESLAEKKYLLFVSDS